MKKLLFAVILCSFHMALFAQTSENTNNKSIEELLQLVGTPIHGGGAPVAHQAIVQEPVVYNFNSRAFAYNTYTGTPNGPISFNLNDPNNCVGLGGLNQNVFAAAWANGVWYGALYPSNNLLTIDTTTGSSTAIGLMSPTSGQIWTGMSYDIVNDVMYAVSTTGATNTLYTVDLVTAIATPVGTAPGPALICLGANNAGNLFSVDIVGDNFGSINKSTGAWTVIGPVGFNCQFAQDIEFDHLTDTCFYTSYMLPDSLCSLRIIDITTGTATIVDNFPKNSNVSGFAIPWTKPTSVATINGQANFQLSASPNPVKDRSKISFNLPKEGMVTLELFDICGKKVSSLVNESLSKGNHEVMLNTDGLNAGIYFCSLRTNAGNQSSKVIITK